MGSVVSAVVRLSPEGYVAQLFDDGLWVYTHKTAQGLSVKIMKDSEVANWPVVFDGKNYSFTNPGT